MPTVPIYIRKTNGRFLLEEEPSELINTLLEAHYSGGVVDPRSDKPKTLSEKMPEPVAKPVNLAEIEDEPEEEPDFSGYVYDPATQRVYNKESLEEVPAKVRNGKIVGLL